MLYLPFHDPEACIRRSRNFDQASGVIGFMVTSTHSPQRARERLHQALCDAAGARPAARLPRGDRLGARACSCSTSSSACTRSASAGTTCLSDKLDHQRDAGALPKLKTIWIESGLAWVPFLMQRLDNE
jgi:hypothetical protein